MRMCASVTIPTEAGNRAIKDGSIGKIIEAFMAKARPEAAYFTTLSGKRTMFVVFDLASTADIPPHFEPFFQGLNAEIEFAPAMDAADLQKGLASL